MRIKLRDYGIFYLIGGLSALWMKYRYSQAGSEELRWILAPVAAWVCKLGGLSFTYVPGVGYVNHAVRFIIAASCSGVQFLIIVMGMLLFTFVHRMGTWKRGALWTLFSLAGAYGYTIFVNGIRIVLAVRIPAWLSAAGIFLGRLSQKQLHTIIGAVVYFAALLLLFWAVDVFLCSQEAHAAKGKPVSRKRGWYLTPVFWYFFIVLAVPFLNRALEKDREGYLDYAVLTGGVCFGVLAVMYLWRKAVSGLRSKFLSKERLFLRSRCAILFSQNEKTGNEE